MTKNVYWCTCRESIIIVRFYSNFYLVDRFSKHAQISNSMKIRPVGVEMAHTHEQTDRQTWRSSYSQFGILWKRLQTKYQYTSCTGTIYLLKVLTFTLSSLLLAWCTNRFNIQEFYILPHFMCMFCIYLRTNSDFCPIQHKLIGFYNRDEKCLQRGTNWVFK